jgi:hypothetical protein
MEEQTAAPSAPPASSSADLGWTAYLNASLRKFILACGMLGLFSTVLIMAMCGYTKGLPDLATGGILGTLGTLTVLIYQFDFGSSSGSEAKTKAMTQSSEVSK